MIKKYLGKITEKIKNYIKEHPSKFKYIVISCAGTVVLTITVVIVGTVSPLLNGNAASTVKSPLQTSTQEASLKKANISRGEEPLLDPAKGNIIKLGVKNLIVTVIQKRLVELDYIESDEPTEEYGETLQNAVQLFQRKNELKVTGEVDEQTYKLLMSQDAKKYTVYIGAEGTDVEQLQSRLYELGYIPNVTGYFGTDTDAAVKEFQKRNGLFEDGNVGKQTREVLYSADAAPMSFHLGDQDDKILSYQQKLNKLGYLTTKPDGKYGTDTVAAVKRFQESNGLIADGYIGPETKELLMSGNASENALTLGDSGDDVTNVQKYLQKLGYLKGTTGYFGSDTFNAVQNFQERNNLTADGKVGSETINRLLSSTAKKYSSSTKKSTKKTSHKVNSSSSYSNHSDSFDISSPNADLIISIAKSKLGARYVYGAKGPSTFDCSGFVYWVLNRAGIRQGYMTSYGWNGTSRYQRINSMDDIRRGDIISYDGHVGIALGNSQMIDASSSWGKVRITNITSSYWTRHFVCAYRIF